MSLLWTGLLMGLMGGFHCAGMCGPIALALPSSDKSKWHYIGSRIYYNLGRVTTYSGMGLVFGFFGLSLSLAGLQQGVSILSGLLILLLQFFPGNLSGKVARTIKLPYLVNKIKHSFSTFFQKKGNRALYSIGLLNGLLPCGFVYLALAGSLSAGTVGGAALYMALFGLGTLPVMLVISISGRIISLNFRQKLHKLAPYAAVLIAILFILRGLSLGIPYVSPKLNNNPQGPSSSSTEITVCH